MSHRYYSKVIFTIVIISLILIIPTKTYSTNYEHTFSFNIENKLTKNNYKIYISITSSIYEYYKKLDHNRAGNEGFSKFVTPNVFTSVAENIKKVTNKTKYNDEIFANAVLEIVHQIPYNKSNIKFPVETIFENSGDCDTLSLLTASIMKAGNLDIVLLLYEDLPISHMNIGIHLNNEPIYHSNKNNPTYYEFEGKKYYTAETTGDNWKVGDQPQDYLESEPTIIPIQNIENNSFAEISSSLNPQIQSSISLSLVPQSLLIDEAGTKITVFGSTSPIFPNQKVTIYVNHGNSQPSLQYTTSTNEFGNYSITLHLNETGKYQIQSSWNGNNEYSGSESDILIINIGLNQLLEKHEISETSSSESDSIQIPQLDSVGLIILNSQPIQKILEKNVTEKNLLIDNEFIILGSDEPFVTEHTVTIPEHEEVTIKRRQIITRQVSEQNFTITNYRKKLNNHLEFTLLKNEKDYSINVRLISDSDLTQITNRTDVEIINMTSHIKENLWHKLTIIVSENNIVFELLNETNTLFTKIDFTFDLTNQTREYKILMKYDADSIIAMKDTKITSLETKFGSPAFNFLDNQTVNQSEPKEQITTSKTEELKKEKNQQSQTYTIISIISVTLIVSIVTSTYLVHKKLLNHKKGS